MDAFSCGGFITKSVLITDLTPDGFDWIPPRHYLPKQELKYSLLSGNVGGTFDIDPLSGVISVLNSGGLDHEDTITNGRYEVVVTAVDNGVPPITTSTTVLIEVSDVNEPPSVSTTRNVKENNPVNTYVGNTITANDPDDEVEDFGTLTFSISKACHQEIGGCVHSVQKAHTRGLRHRHSAKNPKEV